MKRLVEKLSKDNINIEVYDIGKPYFEVHCVIYGTFFKLFVRDIFKAVSRVDKIIGSTNE